MTDSEKMLNGLKGQKRDTYYDSKNQRTVLEAMYNARHIKEEIVKHIERLEAECVKEKNKTYPDFDYIARRRRKIADMQKQIQRYA